MLLCKSVYLCHLAGCPAASDIDHTVHSLCFIPPLCARDSNREGEEDAEEFGEGRNHPSNQGGQITFILDG